MGVLLRLLFILCVFFFIFLIFKRLLTREQQRSVRGYVKIIAFSLLTVACCAVVWRLLGMQS